jgi:hypothetical protein
LLSEGHNPAAPHAVPGFRGLIRGVPDLSGAGRGGPGLQYPYVIADLAPAGTAADLCCFIFWAVAASAFLTLAFQAAVAIYFVSRQLALSWASLVPATLKSGIVTACSCVAVMVGVVFNDFSFSLPAFGFLAAAITGLAGWWLGLVITAHPLLAQLHLAARDIAFAIPRPLSLRRPEAMRQKG